MIRRNTFRNDARGAAMIELAITLPVLTVLMFGIISYGSWIALNHAVQQSANEGARASLAGLGTTERATLARNAAEDAMRRTWQVPPSQLTVAVADDGTTLTVDLTYDASANPLLKLPLVPPPPTMIERRAAVRLAGL